MPGRNCICGRWVPSFAHSCVDCGRYRSELDQKTPWRFRPRQSASARRYEVSIIGVGPVACLYSATADAACRFAAEDLRLDEGSLYAWDFDECTCGSCQRCRYRKHCASADASPLRSDKSKQMAALIDQRKRAARSVA